MGILPPEFSLPIPNKASNLMLHVELQVWRKGFGPSPSWNKLDQLETYPGTEATMHKHHSISLLNSSILIMFFIK